MTATTDVRSKLHCPECGSLGPFYRDGTRQLSNGESAQRWLCRSCGYRFSEPSKKRNVTGKVNETLNSKKNHRKIRVTSRDSPVKKVADGLPFLLGEDVGSHDFSIVEKDLNSFSFYNSKRQVCAQKDAKNLKPQTEIKTVAGDRKIDSATAKGLLLQYEVWLQKEGYGEKCRYRSCIRMLINSGADVFNPENVKEIIAKKKWKDGTKMQAVYAYTALTKMLKLKWDPPKYRQEEAFPFIPDVKEIDALILGARGKLMTAYLRTLKESMADPSEALRIEWTEINGNVIMINHPVKGHYPRPIEVSNGLISMLNALPKTSERVFPTTYYNVARSYRTLRKSIAKKQNNPRILKITLVTFRHWAATMLYHQTRNILLVKKLLGHKKIENTMKYTQLIQFKDNEYEVATATTIEEAKPIIAAGFEFVHEKNGIMIFRKPKRFVSLAM
jgi:integrase